MIFSSLSDNQTATLVVGIMAFLVAHYVILFLKKRKRQGIDELSIISRPQYGLLTTILTIILVAGTAERSMGRPFFCRCGTVRLWSADVNSQENSQQVADAYTFTHITHGFLFYGGLQLVAARVPLEIRLVSAVALEAIWEVIENTNTVVEHYRSETISLNYYGDSVLNSIFDIVAMILGLYLAYRLPTRVGIALVVVMEIGLALTIRDNLTMNIIMFLYPLKALKDWQNA